MKKYILSVIIFFTLTILPAHAQTEGTADIDLVVNKIEADIGSPLVNEKVSILVEIKNQGSGQLVDNTGFMFEDSMFDPAITRDIFYNFDDFEVTNVYMDNYPSLYAPLSGVFSVRIEGRFVRAGQKKLIYNINVNKRLAEKNYSNNNVTSGITVYTSDTDRDAFKISNIRYVILDEATVKFYWETDKPITATLSYRESMDSLFMTSLSNNKSSHNVTVSNLNPAGKYFYKISGEYNGKYKETGLLQFTMPRINEFLMSRVNGTVKNSKINISWNTSMPARSELFYRKLGAIEYASVGSDKFVSSHLLETGILESGSYEFYVTSENQDGLCFSSQVLNVTPADFVVVSNAPTVMAPIAIKDAKLYNSLKGKIIMRVEKNGEAYYVNPLKQEMYSLGRPDDAFAVMRQKGIGISNANLDKLSISLKIKPSGPDQDLDGLSDMMEDAIGTNKTKKDTDGDTYSDKGEVEGGFNPIKAGGAKMPLDTNFANSQSGKIFLATEKHGEAWYINPSDKKRYFLGRPADAFAVMRGLGVGVSEGNFGKL